MLSVGQQEGGVNIACYKYSVSLSVVTAFLQVNMVQPVLLELRMMEVIVTNHHHQQTNTQFLQAQMPSCHSTNSVKALKVYCYYTVSRKKVTPRQCAIEMSNVNIS